MNAIEFDIDMEACGDIDQVILHDEMGEHADLAFVPERTCRLGDEVGSLTLTMSGYNDCAWRWCPECNGATPKFSNYCQHCGAKVVE